MNRLLRESVYPLSRLARMVPGGRCTKTLFNWATLGVRNPRGKLCFLETMLIGRGRFSSIEAFERFCDDLNQESDS